MGMGIYDLSARRATDYKIEDARMKFNTTYLSLPEIFYRKTNPVPVKAPKFALLNRHLAEDIGIDLSWIEANPAIFSGNELAPGSIPIAKAYAGLSSDILPCWAMDARTYSERSSITTERDGILNSRVLDVHLFQEVGMAVRHWGPCFANI
jgi:hypothetical protein